MGRASVQCPSPCGLTTWKTESLSSRDFAGVLGYTDYRNFEQVVRKAGMACFNSGQQVEDHIVDITEMVRNEGRIGLNGRLLQN